MEPSLISRHLYYQNQCTHTNIVLHRQYKSLSYYVRIYTNNIMLIRLMYVYI